MNRILTSLNTPIFASWCNYSSRFFNFAPSTKELFSAYDNYNRRFHIKQRNLWTPKLYNNRLTFRICHIQRRRTETRNLTKYTKVSNVIRFNSALTDNLITASTSRDCDRLLFSATGKEVEKYPEGKPNWEKLQHICVRLAETWPKFFLSRMDYTIFRDDVILEDRIYGRYVRGVHQYMRYIGTIAAAGRVMYPQIEMQVINITPIIEDATVRLRWRVCYLTFIDFLIMLLTFHKFTPEYLRTRGRWLDGYSIYYSDSGGAVYRHVIDKVIPDDEKGAAKGRLTLGQRLLALVGGSGAQKPATSPSQV